MLRQTLVALTAGLWLWTTLVYGQSVEKQAEKLLAESCIAGGLIVHVDCGEGDLTVALRQSPRYVVLGLTRNEDRLSAIREKLYQMGLNGPVCVDRWDGKRLPVIDNLVNLLVVDNGAVVSEQEIMRVLAPKGVALLREGDSWKKVVKPWPDMIDEWTHYYYDASGNRVSKDLVVGPPRHVQWTGGPRWSRNHDHMNSINAMVSANGRVFYVIDEGSRFSIQLPARWVLVARDGFSGVILWKRKLPSWFNHLFPLKSGPSQLTRRLVAVGDRVFVPLGGEAPMSILDAATGKTICTVEETRATEEILVHKGVAYVLVNPQAKPCLYKQEDPRCWNERDRASVTWGWDEKPRLVVAVDTETGKVLWKVESRVVPNSMAISDLGVYFHDGEAVVRLDKDSGQRLWRSEPVERAKVIPTGYLPVMIVYNNTLLFSGKRGQLTGLDAQSGKVLWKSPMPQSGHFCPEDFFVVDDVVWAPAIANVRQDGRFVGRSIYNGEIVREFLPDVPKFVWVMHQRCYPSKATLRYVIPSRIGVEYVDLKTGHWEIHHWVRGGCIYGVMPANGLTYATPHPCACYYQSKLAGFYALAPQRKMELDERGPRLEKGPAYDGPFTDRATAGDWPTYRHDAQRSGATKTTVSTEVRVAWKTKLGTRLTSPVVAAGKVFVADIDSHTLLALDAQTGRQLWHFIAGGRIDSPPTYYKGRVLFGCGDGWVYCLRADDGQLAWRFRVAPAQYRLVAYNQPESVWPLHGSVLVYDGVAYCLAGRSMFLDGGLRLVRLDAETGRLISENVLDDKVPGTNENLQTLIKHKKMPVALPDVLSCDGKFVYMRSQRFDLEGKRVVVAPEDIYDQTGEGVHLFCPTGLLDDSWWHRTYWVYGKNAGEGWGEWFIAGRTVPSGRILAIGDDAVYGYGRHPAFYCNCSVAEHRLFAANKTVRPERIEQVRRAKIPASTIDWKARDAHPLEELTAVDFQWVVEEPPIYMRALVLAGDKLFAAGPPDIVNEREIWGKTLLPDVQKLLAEQNDILHGSRGSLLLTYDASTGKQLAQLQLDCLPVFDGLIAANGRLYLSTADGCLMCLAGK